MKPVTWSTRSPTLRSKAANREDAIFDTDFGVAGLADRSRDRGCSAHPVFPAPSFREEQGFQQNSGRIAPRANTRVGKATGSRECAPDDRLRVPTMPRDGEHGAIAPLPTLRA